jgi:TLC domain
MTPELTLRPYVSHPDEAHIERSCLTASPALIDCSTIHLSDHTFIWSTGMAAVISAEVGYLLGDTVSLLRLAKRGRRLDKLMMLHHVVLVSFLPFYFLVPPSTHQCHRDWYLACFFMMNATTPLLHARYVLGALQLTGSLVHRMVSRLLVVTFFTFRILLVPVLLAINFSVLEPACRVRWYCVAGSTAMACLNAVWLSKLMSSKPKKSQE